MRYLIRNFLFSMAFLLLGVFSLTLTSAAAINDTLHLNLQTTYSNGTIQNGTFILSFNITDNSSASCGPNIVYNHSGTFSTDSRGIASIYLPSSGTDGGNLSSLVFDKQYYLCYYRDGTLKDVTQLSRVPYSFRVSQFNLSQLTVDSNFTMGTFYALLNRTGILTTTPQNALNVVGDINATTTVWSYGLNLTNGYTYALNGSLWTLNYSNFSIVYGYALNATASGISWATANNGTLLNYSSALNGTLLNGTGPYSLNVSNAFFNITNGSGINITFFNGTTGRVGIGLTSPTEILTVNGSIRLERVGVTGNFLLNHNGGDGSYLTTNTNSSDRSTSNTQSIKVLINTQGNTIQTSPTTAVGSARTWTSRFFIPTGSVGTVGDVVLGGGFDHTDTTYAGAVMIIKSTGHVGVNTTTPQNPLNVIGYVNATTGYIVNSTTGMTGNFSIGSCWMAFSGGIAYASNCSTF